MRRVGIDKMAFYTPNYSFDLELLARARGVEVNKFHIGLGQAKMAVPSPDEDIVTMGAEAGLRALQHMDTSDIDLLLFATESSIDQSKAAGVFVHQLLHLPSRCRVVELKQACYSATAGLQVALSILRSYASTNKKVLLIASDIARYGLNTAGESSHGSGAIAMVLSQNPRMLIIEEESGFHTEDVMDFWRPNYQNHAIVDGQLSCKLYLRCLQKTWQQYTELSHRTFSDHAYFCYHVPFPRLVEKAHDSLLRLHGLPESSKTTLEKALHPSLKYGRLVGNCYTASLYLSLLSLLENVEEDLAQKRIGFYSYGSGCTAEFFSGIVQEDYQIMLDKKGHQAMLENRTSLSQKDYEDFYNFPYPTDGSNLTIPHHKKGGYRLGAIQEHKRIYETSSL